MCLRIKAYTRNSATSIEFAPQNREKFASTDQAPKKPTVTSKQALTKKRIKKRSRKASTAALKLKQKVRRPHSDNATSSRLLSQRHRTLPTLFSANNSDTKTRSLTFEAKLLVTDINNQLQDPDENFSVLQEPADALIDVMEEHQQRNHTPPQGERNESAPKNQSPLIKEILPKLSDKLHKKLTVDIKEHKINSKDGIRIDI